MAAATDARGDDEPAVAGNIRRHSSPDVVGCSSMSVDAADSVDPTLLSPHPDAQPPPPPLLVLPAAPLLLQRLRRRRSHIGRAASFCPTPRHVERAVPIGVSLLLPVAGATSSLPRLLPLPAFGPVVVVGRLPSSLSLPPSTFASGSRRSSSAVFFDDDSDRQLLSSRRRRRRHAFRSRLSADEPLPPTGEAGPRCCW